MSDRERQQFAEDMVRDILDGYDFSDWATYYLEEFTKEMARAISDFVTAALLREQDREPDAWGAEVTWGNGAVSQPSTIYSERHHVEQYIKRAIQEPLSARVVPVYVGTPPTSTSERAEEEAEVTDMFLCEASRVHLQPGLYRFRVDRGCEACREAEATARIDATPPEPESED